MGLCRHASTHAAGIVIGREPLSPLRTALPGAEDRSIATQYTMDYLEECGLVKMDFLGLKNPHPHRQHGEDAQEKGDRHRHPEESRSGNEKTFRLLPWGNRPASSSLKAGHAEHPEARKPEKIEDSSPDALYRPGDGEHRPVRPRSTTGPRCSTTARLEPILKETAGVIVYQDR